MNLQERLEKQIIEEFKEIELLRAQPEGSEAEEKAKEENIDNLLFEAFDKLIQLDDAFEATIEELEEEETKTLDEELKKRRKITRVSKSREETLARVFDEESNDQEFLREEFMNKAHYDTMFLEGDARVYKENRKKIKKANEEVESLFAERREALNKLVTLESKTVPFEEMNEQIEEDYKKYLEANKPLPDKELDTAKKEYTEYLKRQEKYERMLKYLETAEGIDKSKYNYEQEKAINNYKLNQVREKLLINNIASVMNNKVNNYEELEERAIIIYELAAEYLDLPGDEVDIEELKITEEVEYIEPEKLYRALSFETDVINIGMQRHYFAEKEKLSEKVNILSEKIDNVYEKNGVKGLSYLKELMATTNAKTEEKELEIKEEVIEPEEKKENIKEEVIEEKVEPDFTPVEEINSIGETVEPNFAPVEEINSIEPIPATEQKHGKYEMVEVKDANPTLIEKIKEKWKKPLTQTILAIVAGVALMTAITTKCVLPEVREKLETPEVVEETPEVVEKEELYEEDCNAAKIGGEVFVPKGTEYFTSSDKASNDINSDQGLEEKKYFVNRIAILDEEGKILGVVVNKGNSAKELTSDLGVDIEKSNVIYHISKGDEDGNFIEASATYSSDDDIAWLRAEDVKVIKQKEEEKEEEKGMSL